MTVHGIAAGHGLDSRWEETPLCPGRRQQLPHTCVPALDAHALIGHQVLDDDVCYHISVHIALTMQAMYSCKRQPQHGNAAILTAHSNGIGFWLRPCYPDPCITLCHALEGDAFTCVQVHAPAGA
jgi:hypothetical protein